MMEVHNDVIVTLSLQEVEEQCLIQSDGGPICNIHLPFSAVHHVGTQEGPRYLQQGDVTTREIFPIVFSAACMAIAFLFTIFVAVRTIMKYKETHERMKATDEVGVTGLDATEETEDGRAQMMIQGKRTSWVGSFIFHEGPQEITPQETIQENDDDDTQKAHMTATSRGGYSTAAPSQNELQKKAKSVNIQSEDKHRDHRVIVSWKDIGCSYPSKQSGKEPIVTLQGAAGALRTKELTAIMGGSGGGKSTLLDILSGRKNLGTLQGEMSILGRAVPICEAGAILKDVAAYVPQNEMFFPTQTPEEAVAFFANLKLGRDRRGDDYRQKNIAGLLDHVGFSMSARTRPIGGSLAGGITIRGLSGGERKRLALACAVAMRPNILFLDEITSGLDSENAVKVVRLLRRLCQNMDVAAAVVIHQPSAKVFELFDQLILLSKGHCIYSGQSSDIAQWYEKEIGGKLPASHLLPDDLLEKSMSWSHPPDARMTREDTILLPTKAVESKLSKENNVGVNALWTFSCIFTRNLENHYVRNLTNLAARIFIYAMTAVLLGLIFWQVGNNDADTVTNSDVQILLGTGLFLTQSSILLPFAQISTFFFDKSVFAAENALGLYEPWMYAFSQFLLEAWVLVMSACVQASIAIPMIGLWNPLWSRVSSFFTMLSFFCISGLVGNSIILFISMISFSQDFAFLNGSSYVTLCLAASGGFVPFEVMPSWLRWLQWISAVKYALQMFIQAPFSGTGVTLIEQMELDTPDTMSTNLVILLAMFMCFASLSIVFLSIQKEKR